MRTRWSRSALAAVGACASTPAPATPSSQCCETAAARYGSGSPTRVSDFAGTTLSTDWHPYAPEPGHDDAGTRTPDPITVADGAVTISGTRDGTTGAMSWHPGQRYGRWEACVKSDRGQGGRGTVTHDATRWSAYAPEWTPAKITAVVDGEEWYSTTDTAHFPPRPMTMTMQLDHFGDAGGPTAIHMDWARQWALPEGGPAELSLAPGDPATGQPTGQPSDYPQRAPRRLG